MNAGRNLRKNTNSLKKGLEKLSSGFRINRSADDAAGLAISEKMRLSISGYEQGENNVGDGISMIQTADGALQEVQELLTRMISLSTQASSDTISEAERQHIQKEIDQILKEISRIKNDTEFNDIPLFNGTDKLILDTDGTPTIGGDIPFEDFELVGTELGEDPLAGNSANMMNLQAIVKNPDSGVNGKIYNLLYDNGGTSFPAIRLTYQTDNGMKTSDPIRFQELIFQSRGGDIKDADNPMYRVFKTNSQSPVSLEITQKIHITESSTEKFYNLEYEFKNLDATGAKVEFLFNADTAYNDNDHIEHYFISGQQQTQTGVYTNGNGLVDESLSSGTTPDSFSIIGTDKALAFTQKVVFVGQKPDLVIDRYDPDRMWYDYNTGPTIQSTDEPDGDSIDHVFSLDWNLGEIASGQSEKVQFKYGIVARELDDNLAGVPVTPDSDTVDEHSALKKIWIQASAESGDSGMWLQIHEMSNRTLGIEGLNVTTADRAASAIQRLKKAKDLVSSNRSQMGADQNRLEHMRQNVAVTKENLVQSESQIRDADVAEEMTKYTKDTILIQSAQAMLAQANQTPQGVLQLMR